MISNPTDVLKSLSGIGSNKSRSDYDPKALAHMEDSGMIQTVNGCVRLTHLGRENLSAILIKEKREPEQTQTPQRPMSNPIEILKFLSQCTFKQANSIDAGVLAMMKSNGEVRTVDTRVMITDRGREALKFWEAWKRGPMKDTGKLKNLWDETTYNIMLKSAPDYPEGDLDAVAEGLLVYIEDIKENFERQHERARAAELKLATVTLEARRAQSALNRALEGPMTVHIQAARLSEQTEPVSGNMNMGEPVTKVEPTGFGPGEDPGPKEGD